MSWVRVWVHVVFTTKCRRPLLTDSIRQKVFQHMRENAVKKGLRIAEINGYRDHVHCLLALGREMPLSKTVQLIKGESSFWINRHKLLPERFQWQDDYWAVSVSEAHVKKLRNYIRKQEQHHASLNFETEINSLVERSTGLL